MKILHTSDWHLGKLLEGSSRLSEQALFLEELHRIVEQEQIDLILLAGDVYDSVNPPAAAEVLFYQYAAKLSKGGQRPIIVIAGNHDSHERLAAASPIALEEGILLFGTPVTELPVGNYGSFSIEKSGPGWIQLAVNGERAAVLAMPYPSERRLEEIITESIVSEEEMQKSYSQKIGELFTENSKHFQDNMIHLAVGHFYVAGGQESGSERSIQLGGSLAVESQDLPLMAQYIALGHLHRPQTVPGTKKRAYYSGSPLQYNKDERIYAKAVNVVEVYPGQEAVIKKIYLSNSKPIELLEATSIENAIALCEKKAEQKAWYYLRIHTNRTLEQGEIRKIKTLLQDIVEIEPVFPEEEDTIIQEAEDNLSLEEQFSEFYTAFRKVAPSRELLELFLKLANESEEGNETVVIETEGN